MTQHSDSLPGVRVEGTLAESSVCAVMIWLRSTDAAAQSDDPQLSVQEGHRSFVFNPPALSHIRYAHFSRREEALESLKFLGQELQEGHTLYVHREQWSFAVPAQSVLYVALARSRAQAVNPDDGSPAGQALHAANAHLLGPLLPEAGPTLERLCRSVDSAGLLRGLPQTAAFHRQIIS